MHPGQGSDVSKGRLLGFFSVRGLKDYTIVRDFGYLEGTECASIVKNALPAPGVASGMSKNVRTRS
jgi:hypothetical protein